VTVCLEKVALHLSAKIQEVISEVKFAKGVEKNGSPPEFSTHNT